MERRMLLAVILSILCVTAYSAITGRGCMAPPPPKDQQDAGQGTDGQTPAEPGKAADGTQAPAAKGAGGEDGKKSPAGTPGAAAKGQPGGAKPARKQPPVDMDTHPQAGVKPSTVTLRSDELEVVVTSQGGAVRSVRELHSFEADRKSPFNLIVPISPSMLWLSTDDTDVVPETAPGGADRHEFPPGPMRREKLQWTHDVAAEKATPEEDAIYTFRTPEGLIWSKQYILGQGPQRFDVTLRLGVRATEGATLPPGGYADVSLLASSGHLREYVRGAFANTNRVIYRLSTVRDVSDSSSSRYGIGVQTLEQKGPNRPRLAVFGMRSAYYLSLYYRVRGDHEPDVTRFWATGEDAALRGQYDENLTKYWSRDRGVEVTPKSDANQRIAEGVKELLHCWMSLRLPVHAGAQSTAEMHFYVGPTERSSLRQDVYAPLDSVITYPHAFDAVADVLLWIYDLWRGLFGSAGVAVILMTLCVRGAMMPLSIRNQLSMRVYGRKVAKLKPKVTELQKKYANNPKKMRDEQMKLYREHGVGFPSGCLMMLVQIPVFFALFSCLRVEYTIRGAQFLWIHDLSGPDRLIDFGSRVIDLGIFWVDSINLLPLLMVALSIVHMRSMPKPADDQQAQQMKMMKWMPIFFAFILYNYTAALAIYMVLSSTVAIVESRIVRRKDEQAQAHPAPARA
jgi:YidC/Oxa1 family membrane protein insertase